jgi:hypothetical protein
VKDREGIRVGGAGGQDPGRARGNRTPVSASAGSVGGARAPLVVFDEGPGDPEGDPDGAGLVVGPSMNGTVIGSTWVDPWHRAQNTGWWQ